MKGRKRLPSMAWIGSLTLLFLAISDTGMANGSMLVFGPSWEPDNIKGCVKEIKSEIEYVPLQAGLKAQRWKRLDKVVQYDAKGRKRKEHLHMGSFPTVVTYYYNWSGKIYKVTQCYESGDLYMVFLYSYNSQGYLAEVVGKEKDNGKWVPHERYTFTFDKAGNISEQVLFVDGKVYMREQYSHKSDTIEVNSTYFHDTPYTYTTTRQEILDKTGRQLRETWVDEDRFQNQTETKYEFDGQGNVIRETTTFYSQRNGGPETAVSYITSYALEYCK